MRAAILFALTLTTPLCSVVLCAGGPPETNGLRQEDRTAKLRPNILQKVRRPTLRRARSFSNCTAQCAMESKERAAGEDPI